MARKLNFSKEPGRIISATNPSGISIEIMTVHRADICLTRKFHLKSHFAVMNEHMETDAIIITRLSLPRNKRRTCNRLGTLAN